MKQYYHYDNPVTILGKRPNGYVLVQYDDGYEELVPVADLVVRKLPRKPDQARFEAQFGSQARVEAIRLMGCVICGSIPSENCHVRSRGAGGNYKHIVHMCHQHHAELHTIGLGNFEAKYNVDLMAIAHEISQLLDS